MKTFIHSPTENLDYKVEYKDELGTDTISSNAWTVPADLTNVLEEIVGTQSVLWLTGGTSGKTHIIVNEMTTSSGRVYKVTFKIKVE